MSPAAMEILIGYAYPGNVRQLEHLMQRAVATARSSELTIDDLPEDLLAEPATSAPPEGTVAAAREKAEREMVIATLAKHAGEIGAAARELQVSRTTMWRLMKKHGIEELAVAGGLLASSFQPRNVRAFNLETSPAARCPRAKRAGIPLIR